MGKEPKQFYCIYIENVRKHSGYLAEKVCSVSRTGDMCHVTCYSVYKACIISLVQSSYVLEIFKKLLAEQLNSGFSSSDLRYLFVPLIHL